MIKELEYLVIVNAIGDKQDEREERGEITVKHISQLESIICNGYFHPGTYSKPGQIIQFSLSTEEKKRHSQF